MKPRRCTRPLARLCAGLVFVAVAGAQVPPETPNAPQQPSGRTGPGQPVEPQSPGIDRPPRDPIDPVWSRVQPGRFQGFPVFPSRLSGYGNYPSLGGAPGDRTQVLPTLPPAGPEVADWPGWVRLRGRVALPYTPENALLVRHADRVWWRKGGDDAFVPLFFHDKFASLGAGGEVQVRHAGEFELLLHSSGRLIAQGPTQLHIDAMDGESVAITVRELTRLRLQVLRRAHSLVLPDGSRLSVAAPDPDAPADQPASGPLVVLIDRAEEPGWYGGRATVFNAGPRAVSLTNAFGETVLPPGHRLSLFLRPPVSPVPGDVVTGDASASLDGDALRLDAPQGGAVSWCGARFQLPPGGTVRFVPMQGRPFEPTPGDQQSKTP